MKHLLILISFSFIIFACATVQPQRPMWWPNVGDSKSELIEHWGQSSDTHSIRTTNGLSETWWYSVSCGKALWQKNIQCYVKPWISTGRYSYGTVYAIHIRDGVIEAVSEHD